MTLILITICCALLLLIFWEDLKFRAVHWPLFPLSFILLFLYRLNGNTWQELLSHWPLNLIFLFLNMSILVLLFRFKGVSLAMLLKEKMGLGDILFFIVLALILPFPVFPLFFILSIAIALSTGFIWFKGKTVPLAGIQAICLLTILVMDFQSLFNLDNLPIWNL